MKVKFANGVVKNCNAPTEQKIFRTVDGQTAGVGWMLILRLDGCITSDELDEALNPESISCLDFTTENEEGEIKEQFKLIGYNKITATTIRYAEDNDSAFAEIQMSKGV